jgi:hypothetical protein
MNESGTETDVASALQAALAEADETFIRECSSRLSKGEEQYGSVKFLSVDTLQEAMDEVVDLANYARFTYVKLFVLQKKLDQITKKNPLVDKEGFTPMKEMFTSGD